MAGAVGSSSMAGMATMVLVLVHNDLRGRAIYDFWMITQHDGSREKC